MISIIHPSPEQVTDSFLDGFSHSERITEKWERADSGWVIRNDGSLHEWDGEKRVRLSRWMHEAAERGDLSAAFDGDRLVGFGCIDGMENGTANLAMLFVDDGYQRCGTGKRLFLDLSGTAKKHGADRLYISAVPSKGTISFYFSLGCRDAERVMENFADLETDRPLIFDIP